MQRTHLRRDDVEILIGIDAKRGNHFANRRHEPLACLVRSETLNQRGKQRHRVATRRRYGGMPRLAERRNRRGQRGLLANLERVDHAAVGELDAHATALVDRVITLEIGPLPEEPGHTDLFHAVFFIGLRDQEQVAAGLKARAGKMRDRDTPRRELVLHVARAAAPDVAIVVKVSTKRRVRPILGVSRHHIGVAHQRERRAVARTRQAGDQIRAFGITRDELDLQPIGLEVLLDDHRDGRLAPRRVRRIDAHEIAQQLDRFVSER